MRRILGIDPGGTTGLAMIEAGAGEPSLLWAGVTDSSLEVAMTILVWAKRPVPLVVVIEDFIGSGPRDASITLTLKRVGFLEGVCRLFGVPVTLQPPQVRRHRLTGARDRLEEKYPLGFEGERHAADALAHALSYAASHRKGLECTSSSPAQSRRRTGSQVTPASATVSTGTPTTSK